MGLKQTSAQYSELYSLREVEKYFHFLFSIKKNPTHSHVKKTFSPSVKTNFNKLLISASPGYRIFKPELKKKNKTMYYLTYLKVNKIISMDM